MTRAMPAPAPDAADPRAAALARAANLGPKSAALLVRAGIDSMDRLRATGAVDAWLDAKAIDPAVSLNLLWALVGAIEGRAWQDVAREDRTSLLLALEDARRARR